uniref:Arrestin_C domain-containing protein n=1 Tax=Steinernema glaseri TaxID=37863 RepID=A0A1I7ZHT3_9BILA
MRSHLQHCGSSKIPIKYEKEITGKLRKYHVRFSIPASCPSGDVFYVTGHIGTSKAPHDMGELPSECIAMPIDVQFR